MTQLIKPLRSGQITIPAPLREKLALDENTLLQISLVGGELHLKPVRLATKAQDSAWFKKLYGQFSKVRKEAENFSQGEIDKTIDKTIDKAVKAVRRSHA